MIVVTTKAVRGIALFVLWVVLTLILGANIPEAGAIDTRAFGSFAILWMVATVLGGMGLFCEGWMYFWNRASDIADWINARLPL